MLKNPLANAGDMGSILGSGRSPGERNGNPLWYSCLENPMDRGAWGLQSMGSQESDTTKQLSTHRLAWREKVSDDMSTISSLI